MALPKGYWINKGGRKFSDETRKKMSESHKGFKMTDSVKKNLIKNVKRGEDHHLYVHGLSTDAEYRSWIKNKRNRDKRSSEGNHTWEEWQALKDTYKNRCPCCLKSEPEINLTQDHIIPLSKGGSDNIENIQPLCGTCNRKKMTKIIKY